MSIDLSGYTSVRSSLFVKLVIPGYQTLLFSDFDRPIVIAGETYTDLGSLLGVTTGRSELRASESEISINISGIPTGNVSDIMDNPVKGSAIEVRRAFFDANTGALLAIAGNPTLKFRGLVNNFSLNEEWDQAASISSYTISLECSSVTSLLIRKSAGRRTHPQDQEKFYPGDVSMSRVPTISKSNLQFGATPSATRAGGK